MEKLPSLFYPSRARTCWLGLISLAAIAEHGDLSRGTDWWTYQLFFDRDSTSIGWMPLLGATAAKGCHFWVFKPFSKYFISIAIVQANSMIICSK
mmetsp:Transcript_22252/g.32498  ORF Transcript_22252/g.32498 Transcript_22252/m.32498 type:complete len:95 (+) Transcript_22252:1024-1308(+)